MGSPTVMAYTSPLCTMRPKRWAIIVGNTAWQPHRPAPRQKSEGGIPFKLVSEYEPAGDQPAAIAKLIEGIESGLAAQTLLARARLTPALLLQRERRVAASAYLHLLYQNNERAPHIEGLALAFAHTKVLEVPVAYLLADNAAMASAILAS